MKKIGLFSFAKRMVLPFAGAIIANLIFALVYLIAWLNGATLASTPIALILLFLFIAAFPFAWFWLMKLNVIDKGVEYIYNTADPVMDKLIDLVVSSIVLGKEKVENSPAVVGNSIRKTGDFIKKLDVPIPNTFKRVFSYILDRAPIVSTLKKLQSTMEFNAQNLPLIQAEVKQNVASYVKDDFVPSSQPWLWALGIINLLAMVMAWVYFA